MKKTKYLLSSLAILILLTLGLIIAQSSAQPSTNLSDRLLQKQDLSPSEHQIPFYIDELTLEEHIESGGFDLIAMKSEGFSQAYNSHSGLVLNDGKGAFMDNTILLFNSQQEAKQAFSAVLTHLNTLVTTFEPNAPQQSGDWEETTTTALTLNDYPAKHLQNSDIQQAKVLESYYNIDGFDFVVRYFIGVSNNRVFLLMVDGLPNAETKAVFEELTLKFINRQS